VVSTPPPDYPADRPPGYGPPGYPPPGYPPPAYGAPGYSGYSGYSGYPAPGYGPPGYGPPGYGPPGYGPPGYGPPGYGPPGYPAPGYGPPGYGPPGYGPPGYGPPGYPAPGGGPPPALKPGVIPLRPLTLSDIFNGAVGYIRANPKTTLGLTAAVVVAMQLVTLLINIGPLTAIGSDTSYRYSSGDTALWTLTSLVGAIATGLAGILLSGMLTVVVGRAVFGASITVAEAWTKLRGRLLPLIGLTALLGLGGALLIGTVTLILVAAAAAGGNAAAVLLGLLLVPALIAACGYLLTMLSFASPLIVLEQLPMVAAMSRSFALVRNSFWRVLGILLLAGLVAYLVAGAVGIPFNLVGEVLAAGAGASGPTVLSTAFSAVGSTIGQIITTPFSAGVVVLLYTDRRIRAEAFDLVLQTGAAGGPAAAESTDSLWLTRPV
jgi:hypothetical protein